jgi:hypothetical protein
MGEAGRQRAVELHLAADGAAALDIYEDVLQSGRKTWDLT